MQRYSSRSGKPSGVIGFEIGNNFITVQFTNFKTYTYTYRSAGMSTVETMKNLALAQQGLSTFIAQHDPKFEHS